MTVIIAGARDRRPHVGADAACTRHQGGRLRAGERGAARSASASTHCRTPSRSWQPSISCRHWTRSAIRTKELIYINRLGQEIWREARGTDAGFDVSAILRYTAAAMQKVLYDAVMQRLGPRLRCARAASHRLCPGRGRRHGALHDCHVWHIERDVAGRGADRGGRHPFGGRGDTSIRRRVRRAGRACCCGAERPTGRSSCRAAPCTSAAAWAPKLALYPIAPGQRPDTRLTNWAIAIKVADGTVSPPPKDSWSRVGRMDDVVPYSRRFKVPDVDVEGSGAGNPDLLRVSDVRPRSVAAVELRPGDVARRCGASRCTRSDRTGPPRPSSTRAVSPTA